MTDEKTPETKEEPNEEVKAINPVLAEANASAERMEKATAEMKLENDRKESIAAELAVGGRTLAGAERREKTQHEKDVADATKFIADDEEE